jgi:biopolymer transport protein ExbB/TolQ
MNIKTIVPVVLLLALGGCASTNTASRLDALEADLNKLKASTDQAMQSARSAQSAASNAAGNSEVAEANRMAQRALDVANETAERVSRMQSECCRGK